MERGHSLEYYETLGDKLHANCVEVNGPLHSKCLIWTRVITSSGYGQVRWGGNRILVHRASWEIHNGPIPEGMCVLHSCDNPPCCNVDHLFLGTQGDNMTDMVMKGRHEYPGMPGEDHPNATLTERQVLEIKWLLANSSVPTTRIAGRYNATKHAVYDIKYGRSWVHVTETIKPEPVKAAMDRRF